MLPRDYYVVLCVAALATSTVSCGVNEFHDVDNVSSRAHRIIGGQPVSDDAVFATVAIARNRRFRCSGVLIAPTVVLTAGHCIVEDRQVDDPDSYKVIVGVPNLYAGTIPTENQHDITAIHLNPNYDFTIDETLNPGPSDFAVLELAEPVVALQPILVFSQAQLASLTGRDPMFLAGYGCRDRGPLPDPFQGPAGALHEGKTFRYVIREESLHVAGTPITCPGDSGGPAYVEVASRRWVLGVTSGVGVSSLHVLASIHEDWMREVTDGAYAGALAPDEPCRVDRQQCGFGLACHAFEGESETDGHCLDPCVDVETVCPQGSGCYPRTLFDGTDTLVCLKRAAPGELCGPTTVCEGDRACTLSDDGQLRCDDKDDSNDDGNGNGNGNDDNGQDDPNDADAGGCDSGSQSQGLPLLGLMLIATRLSARRTRQRLHSLRPSYQ